VSPLEVDGRGASLMAEARSWPEVPPHGDYSGSLLMRCVAGAAEPQCVRNCEHSWNVRTRCRSLIVTCSHYDARFAAQRSNIRMRRAAWAHTRPMAGF